MGEVDHDADVDGTGPREWHLVEVVDGVESAVQEVVEAVHAI